MVSLLLFINKTTITDIVIIIFDRNDAVFPDFPAQTKYFKSDYYSWAICVKICTSFQVVQNNAGPCCFQSSRKTFCRFDKVP